jgi:hypothetical protein
VVLLLLSPLRIGSEIMSKGEIHMKTKKAKKKPAKKK